MHNACPIHGDIEIPTELFHARWRRCTRDANNMPNIKYLCRECYPMYKTGIEKIVDDILISIGIN